MTQNQIAWANLKETKEHNDAVEAETKRANLAAEAETKRANLASESIRATTNSINQAHYERSDAEVHRHNVINEQIDTRNSAIAGYNAVSNRIQAQAATVQAKAKADETAIKVEQAPINAMNIVAETKQRNQAAKLAQQQRELAKQQSTTQSKVNQYYDTRTVLEFGTTIWDMVTGGLQAMGRFVPLFK